MPLLPETGALRHGVLLNDTAESGGGYVKLLDPESGDMEKDHHNIAVPDTLSCLRGSVLTLKAERYKDMYNKPAVRWLPVGEVPHSQVHFPTREAALKAGMMDNPRNAWMHDFIHPPTENAPRNRARVLRRLRALVASVPFEVSFTGYRRRWLNYLSDGGESQEGLLGWVSKRWVRRPRFKVVPYPGKYKVPNYEEYGSYPLMYSGPAWCVRFTVDGEPWLSTGCRVWLTNDLKQMISSDWCQRDDMSKEHINLVRVGSQTLASWIMGPLLSKNTHHEGTTFMRGRKVMQMV
jgi:hypothetical protein